MALIDHDSALGREILGFEAARQGALVSGDPEALDRILHEDLVHVHSSGQVHGKAAFIAHVGKMGGFVSITRGALELREAMGGVLITGPTLNRVRRIGSGELAELDGFGAVLAVPAGRGWQVLLSQVTLLKK
ncbi:nuclear transport factor 2 family protein [Paracoccus sp. MBLB3053]|uniref:Nuclear transport factor 2 family protein n=1 Tax=Paracoccus aurantius TaxID=3073814 RepID=A0ABU2HZB3_9RHOB|nr:nuclear transport factor 2 family protein [Paracoccus sp. MBLB3053]MDS9469895.1 nuclear transport factor 2 family protein [Paracoccus sp. MBLB3053]